MGADVEAGPFGPRRCFGISNPLLDNELASQARNFNREDDE
jgi:hypothetical protein